MTMAISKAVEAARRSSSARRPATRRRRPPRTPRAPGSRCGVVIPQGQIALGKLAQALIHGARVVPVSGNFDEALDVVRELGRLGEVDRRQLDQPVPHRGPEDRPRSRSSTRSATRPTFTASRSATPATSPPTGGATCEYAAARPRRPHARACSAGRPRARRRSCAASRSCTPRRSPPPSASATRRAGTARSPPATSPAARSARSPTPRSSTPTGSSRPTEGVFVEPASAASVAGLRKAAAAGLVERGRARGVHGHRARPQGPAARDRRGAAGRAGRRDLDAVAAELGLQ